MKKLVTILLLLSYTIGVSGASVQLHYCCGKLSSVGLQLTPKASSCSHQAMVDDGTCCQYQQVALQIDDDQVGSDIAAIPQAVEVELAGHTYPTTTPQRPLLPSSFSLHSRGSPPVQAVPLFVLYRVFRN